MEVSNERKRYQKIYFSLLDKRCANALHQNMMESNKEYQTASLFLLALLSFVLFKTQLSFILPLQLHIPLLSFLYLVVPMVPTFSFFYSLKDTIQSKATLMMMGKRA